MVLLLECVAVTPSEVRLQGKVSYLFSLPLSDLDFVLICLDIYISIECYRLSDLDCILSLVLTLCFRSCYIAHNQI
jgi:hypothetical protein